MKKLGLISCSPKENSLSAQGLYYAKALIEEKRNLGCSLFFWKEIWSKESMFNQQVVAEYAHELSLCEGYIWAAPIHCGKISYHASQFLEQFSEPMMSKSHGIIIAAGSPYYYLGYRDFSFQLMVETNGIVLPRAAFICNNEFDDSPIHKHETTSLKIKEILDKLEHLVFKPFPNSTNE